MIDLQDGHKKHNYIVRRIKIAGNKSTEYIHLVY